MHKPIMIVGDKWGNDELRTGVPFSGAAGSILRGLLQEAGIEEQSVYKTNVFPFIPPGNSIKGLLGSKAEAIPGYRSIEKNGYLKAQYAPWLDKLHDQIREVNPNVIVALGNVALWALTKTVGIMKHRGAPTYSIEIHGKKYKVLPTWSPGQIIKQWELRVIALSDLYKAKTQSTSADIQRPSHLLYLEPDLTDIKDFYEEYLKDQPFLSCDVETKQRTITEVGYATADGSRALVIPFWQRSAPDGNYWKTLEDELAAWNWVRRINKEFPLIGQNFSYDMRYFWVTLGITCPKFAGDTMIIHHSMQPELKKGLGFLASIYTNEPSWKFMRTEHDTLKTEDS